MTATATRYRANLPLGGDGFGRLLHAEWTKFRTVRGWRIATVVAAVFMIGFGYLAANGSHSTIQTSPDKPPVPGHLYVPIGPDGEAVTDSFTFLHQPLSGDGTLTARITSLTGSAPQQGAAANEPVAPAAGAAAPWSKAGLIVKQNTSQGSAYAAIMITGGHGIRLQHNYTGDLAGPAGSVPAGSGSAGTGSTGAPRWLRLTRSGDTITGYTSADGSTWTRVGSLRMPTLTGAVQVGLFATSPGVTVSEHHFGGGSSGGGISFATAVFDRVGLTGASGTWTGTGVGAGLAGVAPQGSVRQSGGAYTITGTGDIAPDVSGQPGENQAIGTFAMLIVFAVLAVLFITTEYRRGLIRTSLTASPRRERVLAAKALVVAAVTFVVTLVAAAVSRPIADHIRQANGNFIYPVNTFTSVRVLAGTAALLALIAVLGLAVGTIARRSAAAVSTVIVLVVLPYLLATSGGLPNGPAEWLLRISPAAGFAIQQTLPAYPQVSQDYSPMSGFFPLTPWVGLAVTCAWALLALGLAGYLLRRRDA